MSTHIHISKNKHHNGFVLLFAVVVSAVIFFIGAGIFSIAYKELLVSSLAQDSQKSIFAADSGVECGLQAYQDNLFDNDNVVGLDTYSCFGQSINSSDSNPTTRIFRIFFPDNGSCARVSVNATIDNTIIFFSQGYNKCNPNTAEPLINHPGLTERVYQVEVPIE